jgi:RNA polymerase sigma-70 factor (ECF subfamily)
MTTSPGSYDEPTDQALIARSRSGDKRAFDALVHRHHGWLHRFISRYVWNTDDAFDVLQEALAGAWLSLPRYDQAQSFNTWLRSIALNKCRDRARRNIVRRAFFAPASESRRIDDASDTALTPDMSLEFKQAADSLNKAIASLPRSLKEPLILTALEGLSQKETAELLHISIKAVETRVHRAKQKLAKQLDQSQMHVLLHKT